MFALKAITTKFGPISCSTLKLKQRKGQEKCTGIKGFLGDEGQGGKGLCQKEGPGRYQNGKEQVTLCEEGGSFVSKEEPLSSPVSAGCCTPPRQHKAQVYDIGTPGKVHPLPVNAASDCLGSNMAFDKLGAELCQYAATGVCSLSKEQLVQKIWDEFAKDKFFHNLKDAG